MVDRFMYLKMLNQSTWILGLANNNPNGGLDAKHHLRCQGFLSGMVKPADIWWVMVETQ